MSPPAPGDPLHEAVAGARERNPWAYERLFEMLGPAAMRVAGRMGLDPGEAEDVLQETFLKVFERIGTLENPASFRSWFFSILVNRCREHFRRRKPEEPLSADAAERPPDPAPDDSATEFARAAARFAETLPPLERDLFQRVLIDRKPYVDIARDLGVTPEVVRTRVFRLRKRLRELWVDLKKEG